MKVLIPCIALTMFFSASCSKQQKPHFSFQPLVTLTDPVVKTVPLYKTYPGYMEAYKTVDVQSQIAGQLTGMYFEEGSEVKQGEVLFTIDSRPYRATLDKAQASLASSYAALKYAEDIAVRFAKLLQEEYVAQLKYDEYLTNVVQKKCDVQIAKADVDTAKLNLEYTTIYSPISGIAGKKQIDVGNFISIGETPSLVTINQVDPIFASFYIPDVDLPIIQSYQNGGELKTIVYLNEDPNMQFEGKLTLINNQVDTSTGSIFMKATLCNPQKKLWPGEFVQVKVILKMIENAILLPLRAVQQGQDGGYVFVVDSEGVASTKNVKTGQKQGDYIVIEEGINSTDKVVLDGQISIVPGVKVVIKEPSSAPQAPDNQNVSMVPQHSSVKQFIKEMKEHKPLPLKDHDRSVR